MTAPLDTFRPLPALKHLGDLASVRPVIVVDSREQTPLPIRRLASTVATLTSGDYSFAGGEELFAVERKSIPDLIQCCMGENRARFERELHRLRGFKFARLLIVGTRAEVEGHQYRSNITSRAILHTLAAFEARYVPVVWAPDPDSAARRVETWAWWFARELVVTVNKVWRATPSPEDESREARTAGAKE